MIIGHQLELVVQDQGLEADVAIDIALERRLPEYAVQQARSILSAAQRVL